MSGQREKATGNVVAAWGKPLHIRNPVGSTRWLAWLVLAMLGLSVACAKAPYEGQQAAEKAVQQAAKGRRADVLARRLSRPGGEARIRERGTRRTIQALRISPRLQPRQ